MKYSFAAFGHPNITARHKTTLEFTKDRSLTLKGDCIIGVNSDFKLSELKKFKGKIKMTIRIDNLTEDITYDVNPDFNDDKEIVVRKSNFASARTWGTGSDKACADIKRELISKLRDSSAKLAILITTIK